MRNPNVRILVIAMALIVLVGAAGLLMFRQGPTAASRPSPQLPLAADGAVQAYLRVQVGDQVWDLIPLADGESYTITQPDGRENVVHVTDRGAVMHFSTCHNQSCVQQGQVTLDNRDSRVLGNMIICLPNEVILEVLTPEEAGMEAVK